MKKPKLDVLVAMFAYAGNGGVATVLPDIATWLMRNYKTMLDDERIGRIGVKKYGDIPLTMERNRVVKDAKDGNFDLILMIDSDNLPDLYLNHIETAKPFWDTSFEFVYERLMRGIPSVICAPYCGPPPHPVHGGEENVYVFYASGTETDDKNPEVMGSIEFKPYTREHASQMRGIQPCAAGPTGFIIYTTDAFDLMPINQMSDEEILEKHKAGEITTERAKQLIKMESWFFYEFTDGYQTNKASTEDVTNTREINFAGLNKFGEPVVFCNWDAWAGHMKPKCVGAPATISIEQVSQVFAEAVRNNISAKDSMIQVDFTGDDLPATPIQQNSSQQLDLPLKDFSPQANDDYLPQSTKALRMGKPFMNPSVSDDDCKNIRDIIQSAFGATRCAVIGDKTGEVAHAVNYDTQDCTTFAISVGPCWDDYSSVPQVKLVGKSSIEREEEDPVEFGAMLPEQELDAIVIHGNTDEMSTVTETWFNRHLKSGGAMVITDPNNVVDGDWLEQLDIGDAEVRVVDGTCNKLLLKKRSKHVPASV